VTEITREIVGPLQLVWGSYRSRVYCSDWTEITNATSFIKRRL